MVSAPILYVKGRQHPVQIFHTVVSQMDYVDSALRTFFQIHVDKPPGDVLIFLPGLRLLTRCSSVYFSILTSSLNRPRRYRESRKIYQNVCQTASHRAHGGESFYRVSICHPGSNLNLGYDMSYVRIIAAFPTSTYIFLDRTKYKKVYISDEYRRDVYNDTWHQVCD